MTSRGVSPGPQRWTSLGILGTVDQASLPVMPHPVEPKPPELVFNIFP